MASLPEGMTISFQGYMCTREFEFTRNLGLEPDVGFVHLTRSEFEQLKLVERNQRALTEVERGAGPVHGFETQGELIIAEVLDDREYSVTFKDILVSERAIETVFSFRDPTDPSRVDPTDVVRVELTDIRELWKTEGIVFGWLNVPKQAAGQKGFDKDLPGVPDTSTQERVPGGKPRRSLLGRSAVDASVPERPPILDDPNLIHRIEQAIRASHSLFGAHSELASLGDAINKLDAENEAAKAAAASEAIQHSVSGPAIDAKDFIPGTLNAGAPWTLIEVLNKKILPNLPGHPIIHYIPADVKDQPVSAKPWKGVRTKVALHELLTEFQLELALNPNGNISLWHKGEGDLQEANGGFLNYDPGDPGMDERVTNKRELVGMNFVPRAVLVLGPPIIDTEKLTNFEPVGEIGGKIVPLEAALKNIGLNLNSAHVYAFETEENRAAFFPVDHEGAERFKKWAFKWYRIPGGTKENADKLPMLDRGRVDELGALLPIRVWTETVKVVDVAALITSGLGLKDPRATGSKALDAFLKSGVKNNIAVFNLPFAESDSGYRIDRERGIIEFSEIQGVVAFEGVTAHEAFLLRHANVTAEFGFTRKPGENDDITIDQFYHSFWVRSGLGDELATVSKAEFDQDLTPHVIYRDDLQQVDARDGDSNKDLLDSIAKKLATDVLQQPPVTTGAVVELHRPIALVNTGRVKSITWATKDGTPNGRVPHVIAHVGMVAPFTPKPELRTRARSGPSADVLKNHVLAPKGLT